MEKSHVITIGDEPGLYYQENFMLKAMLFTKSFLHGFWLARASKLVSDWLAAQLPTNQNSC